MHSVFMNEPLVGQQSRKQALPAAATLVVAPCGLRHNALLLF
ncbi:hypothetical protein GALL_482140 [mine drainage metagenome]|uniref:Uncharacterized protein n=1 Tax=mine drainage metagenome TaxID=410659 RepID=A0A1J5PHB8_9ZZZZ